METNNSISSGGSTGGSVGGGISAPQDGGFEAGEMQDTDVFSPESESITRGPEADVSIASPQSEVDARGIMDIPGTAHDKLESLAGISDPDDVKDDPTQEITDNGEIDDTPEESVVEEIEENPEAVVEDEDLDKEQNGENSPPQEIKDDELSPEQKLMLIQLEIIKMLISEKKVELVALCLIYL